MVVVESASAGRWTSSSPNGVVIERLPPGVTAYVFEHLREVEILRRRTQMPDERLLDMLVDPFAVYYTAMSPLVVVNDPSTPLNEHLHRLQMIMY
jgi:hypothetical protein